MRLTIPLLLLALNGCPSPNVPQPQPTPAKVSRFFDEKVRCATVGERWEGRICGEGAKATPMCVGWWAYNPERDTCVGVFVTTSYTNEKQFQMLNVLDLLTSVELEEACYQERCPVDTAKARWILGESPPSLAAPATAPQ